MLKLNSRKRRRFFLLAVLVTLFTIFADSAPVHAANYEDFIIEDYHVDIKVTRENICYVTETIDMYYLKPCHGFYRDIPTTNRIITVDGDVVNERVTIDEDYINVNTNYSIERSSDMLSIKIGSANKLVTGPQRYTISYVYNIGPDRVRDHDEFYQNLIGNSWNTTIQQCSFKVEFPTSVSSYPIELHVGSKGIDNSYLTVSGNSIFGEIDFETFNDAISLYVELPDEYFNEATDPTATLKLIALLIPVAGLVISFILWLIWGRDVRYPQTVEVVPPDGFNSAELGTIYKGKAESKDVTSLLIYLASKGYLRIDAVTSQRLFGPADDYKITLLKTSYEGDNYIEKMFFEGLRSCAVADGNGTMEVLSNHLSKMSGVSRKIMDHLNSKPNKRKLFEPNVSGKRVIIVLFIIASLLAMLGIPMYLHYSEIAMIPFGLLFPCIGLTVMLFMVCSKQPFLIFFGLFWGSGFGGIPFCLITLPALRSQASLIHILIQLGCIIGMCLLFYFMPKRTPYGAALYAKAKSYRDYIKLVEEDKLKALAEREPAYFYDTLPYAYVLGVYEEWISQFSMLAIPSPDWTGNVGTSQLTGFIRSTTDNFTTRATPVSSGSSSGGSHSSSSRSSSSRSSGGGRGGGGGRSW